MALKPKPLPPVVLEKRTLVYKSAVRQFSYTGLSNEAIIDAMGSLYPSEDFTVSNSNGKQLFDSTERHK